MSESTPKAGEGVSMLGGKVLQVEGTARVRVLRQKHNHCAGGKPRRLD